MSRYAGRLPRTYARAEKMLGNRNTRTILNNTIIARSHDGDTINIAHHGSVIGQFHRDGSVHLTNAGYGSVSTRERLNAMAPAHVSFVQRNHSQQVHVWQGDDTPARVIDGGTVWIDQDGEVTTA